MSDAVTAGQVKIIGFIGAGIMGAPMVRRLCAAGFIVRVWNRTAEKTRPLVTAGAIATLSPAEAASGADVVLSCLSDAEALGQALFSNQGVAEAAHAPPLLADFSTIGPSATRDLAQQLQARCGTRWVDAPVSGGAVGAERGRLVIFCGGTPADVAHLSTVFAALSHRVTRTGELGAGQTLKLCNQLIVASNLVAIAESLSLARANGLDPAAVPAALADGFADSLPLQIFGPRMASNVTKPLLGELGLMLKDLHAVEALARPDGREFPLMDAALQVYRAAVGKGLARDDVSTLIKVYDI